MSTEYPCIYFEKDGKCRKFSDNTYISYCVMGPCPEHLEQLQAENDRLKEEVQQMLWIPVEERLPETGTVLATDGRVVITAPSSSVTSDGQAITHWMLLPKPPKEEKKDD